MLELLSFILFLTACIIFIWAIYNGDVFTFSWCSSGHSGFGFDDIAVDLRVALARSTDDSFIALMKPVCG